MHSDFSVAVVLAFIVCVVLGSINLMVQRSCSIYAEETGTETKYRHFDTCYIKTPTGFMRWDEFKARATTREQTK